MRRGHGAVTHEEPKSEALPPLLRPAGRRIGCDADAAVETDTDRGLMKPSCVHERIYNNNN